MVRETRHLWVGNLPENVKEERIREHFQRYGRVQSVKLLPRFGKDDESGSAGGGAGGGLCAAVAFMDIKSAAKARASENVFEDRSLVTDYYDPLSHESGRPAPLAANPIPPQIPHRGRHSGYNGIGHPDDGYERSSSHFFERRNDSDAPAAPFRRQGPHHPFRERPYRNGPYGQAMNERGPPGGCHYRGPAAWGYDSPAPPRYPPQDYLEDRPERNDFGSVQASSMASAAKNRTSLITSMKSRKRKSSRSPSRSRSRSDSRSPTSSLSRSRSPSSESGGSRSRSRSRSRSLSPRSVSHSRSSSRSSSRSQKTTRSAQSSSPSRSSRSGSSRSPGWARPRPRNCGSQKSGSLMSSGGAGGMTGGSSDDRRPLAICVRNLPLRSSDTSLKDGLFHEYKKHGKVVTVKVAGQLTDRVAVVRFKKAEDVEKALEVSRDKLFFGCKIEVTPCDSELDIDDNEFRPLEADLDEYHPKATRTLFIGNLEKDVTGAELRRYFDDFGTIIEIDIKKQSQSGASANAYAFCQYADIASVVRAMRRLDGEQVGNTRVKLGFGKSMPTNCVWLHGIADTVSDKYLARYMNRFGHVSYVAIDRERSNSLVFYDQVPCAQAAVQELRGRALAGRKLQVDFASRECQAHFFELVDREPSRGMGHRFPGPGGPPLTSPAAAIPGNSSLGAARASRTPSVSSASGCRPREKERNPSATETRSRQGTSREDSLERELDTREGLSSESRDHDKWRSGLSPSSSIKAFDDKDTSLPLTPSAATGINGRTSSKGRSEQDEKEQSPMDVSASASPIAEARRDRVVRETAVVERDRSRRFGSGGSSSSGLSVDTVGQAIVPPNGNEVFSQARDSADGTTSSGEEQVSDTECPVPGVPGGKKSKLSGSSDSGVSDVSVGDQLASAVGAAGGTKPALTPVAPCSQSSSNANHFKPASSNRPSRRVSRLSTDSSGDSKDKHVLPKTIPGEVCTRRRSQEGPGTSSRPGTPLCDENSDEIPTDPRKGRPPRPTERPMNLPLPRFAQEFLGPAGRRLTGGVTASSGSSPIAGQSLTSSEAAFRIPSGYSLSSSPSRAAVPGSPRCSVAAECNIDSSDSEISPGSSPRAALHSADLSLAEQLRQWEQRYEQWSTRSLQTPSVREVEKFAHKPPLLNFDELKTQKPSDIVLGLLAKHSVFDEDQKRLESFRDKYEPDVSALATFAQFKTQTSVFNFKPEGVTQVATPSPPPPKPTVAITPSLPLLPLITAVAPRPLEATVEAPASLPNKLSPVEIKTEVSDLIKQNDATIPAETEAEATLPPAPATPPVSPPITRHRPRTPPMEPPPVEPPTAEPAVELAPLEQDKPDQDVALERTPETLAVEPVSEEPVTPPVLVPVPVETTEVEEEPLPTAVPAVESRETKLPEEAKPEKEVKTTEIVKSELAKPEKPVKDKNGQRSRHSSSNSHRKEKEKDREKSKDKEKEKERDREAKEKEKDRDREQDEEKAAKEAKSSKEKDASKLESEASRRKSRESEMGAAEVPTLKRRRSVDAGVTVAKKVKTEKDKEKDKDKTRDPSRDGEREKSKNHDKENKESVKSQKSENRTDPKCPITLATKKSDMSGKSPKSSTDYFGEKSSTKVKSKKDKKDKDREKDKEKEKEKEKEKDKDKEKEKEKEKEREEKDREKEKERKEKKKEEDKNKEQKEKQKTPTAPVPAPAAALSSSSRRKSDSDKSRSSRIEMQRSSSQRSSISSRKKSQSDSESVTEDDMSSSESDFSNDDSDMEQFGRRKSGLNSFFDAEPTYFSMYDKVKARSLKLQQQRQQQEERKQQTVGKLGAFRQGRHSGSRSKDDKKLHWETSDSDSDSPVRSNRPRPVSSASAMAVSKLSSTSSEEDSEPVKFKSEKAIANEDAVPAKISSKRSSFPARSKCRQLLSSQSDSESASETEKSKKVKNVTEQIVKRRPSAPEPIVSGAKQQNYESKSWQRSLSASTSKKKKEPKNATGPKLSARGEEKMETIFGPLSDESDDHQPIQASSSSSKLKFSSVYASDSDSKSPAPEKARTPSPVEKRKKKSKVRERNRSRKSESKSESEAAQPLKSFEDLESDAEDLAEAGKALESKLLEDAPEPTCEPPVPAASTSPPPPVQAERKSSKKKKKSKRSSREDRSSKDSIAEDSSHPKETVVKEVAVKEEREAVNKESPPPALDVFAEERPQPKQDVPAAQVSVKQEVPDKSPNKSPLSMPTLWEPPAAQDKRSVICKLETEDAVAGLLMETFDDERNDFGVDQMEEEPTEHQVQQPQIEDSTPSEEALKAVQSLQCETDDMDISQEMLMEPETQSGSVSVFPARSESEDDGKIRGPDVSNDVPASPPALLIDETRMEGSPLKEDQAPQTPDMVVASPQTPDIDRPPRTPDISAAFSKSAKAAEKSVIQQLGSPVPSPTKAAPKPAPVPIPRQIPGYRRSSRNSISESSFQDVYAFTDHEPEGSAQPPQEKVVPTTEIKPETEHLAPAAIPTAPAGPVPALLVPPPLQQHQIPQQPPPSPAVAVITSSNTPSGPGAPLNLPLPLPQAVQPQQETIDVTRKVPERPAVVEEAAEKVLRPAFVVEQPKVIAITSSSAASPRHSPRGPPLPLALANAPPAKMPEAPTPSVLKVELPQLASAVMTKEATQVPMVDPVTGLLSPMRRHEESSTVVRSFRPVSIPGHPPTSSTPVTITNPASEVVRHLPPTTVLTPVATKPAALAAYPDVPLTRDVPPAQQHQPSVQVTPQPVQQHASPAPLTLPAGVPVSLSGGATVIAVASSNRTAQQTAVTRHTASGTTVHLATQPQAGGTTIVRTVSTSPAQPTATAPRLAASTTLVPVSVPQQPPTPATVVRPPVSSATIYTQPQSVQATGPAPPKPPSTPTVGSVTVLPAVSRPPSTTGPSGAVSVYAVYGPPSTTMTTTSSSRVTITSSTTARSTPSATPPAQSPYRTVFADAVQHYHGVPYHGVPAQHSPAAPTSREELAQQPREDERAPTSLRPTPMPAFGEAPVHPLPIHEMPTPPPAHQHHAWHQQFLFHQMLRNVQRLAYSPAPGQHPVAESDRERERISASFPPHLRVLTSGGEHRSTESPLQGSIPLLPPGQNYHRQGSGTSGYPPGHVLDPSSPSPQSRQTHVAYMPEEGGYQSSPPPAHFAGVLRATPTNGPSPGTQPTPASEAPLPLIPAGPSSRPLPIRTPPHASQVPPQADSLVMLLQRYPIMWQGLLALKNDHAVVQMHFISGNPHVARGSLPLNPDGTTLPLRVAQRMRLEQQQLEGVARKMRIEEEHCILLALPCGRDAMDVLQQSNNLGNGFITYLQLKQAAGIVNIAAPGSQQPSYVVHIFPSCDFANESLARITPDLLHRVADIAHLLVIIATV